MKKTFPLAAVAALAFAAPASAAPTSFWFDCTGTAPLQTIDVSDYTWSDTAPTAGFADGAGCGWLDPGALQGSAQPNPLYDAGFGGTYAGEIRKFDLTLYGPEVSGLSRAIDLQVQVDGQAVNTYTGLEPSVSDGPDDTIKAYTYTAHDLDIPAVTATARSVVFAVSLHYIDSSPGWLQGAKEAPSNVRLFAWDDLTQEEQDDFNGVFGL